MAFTRRASACLGRELQLGAFCYIGWHKYVMVLSFVDLRMCRVTLWFCVSFVDL
jgi:hypothetical protein